jgi:hypothetical protein
MRSLTPDRRTFLVGSAVAAGAASPALARSAGGLAAPALALFDPGQPVACAFAQGQAARGLLAVPLEGDRIRLARQLFLELTPRSAAAMTGYADFLLLSDAAREYGYRARLLDRAPAGPQSLFVWTVEKA